MADLSDYIEQRDIDEALKTDSDVHQQKLDLADKACEYWKSIYPVEEDGRRTPPRPPGTGRDLISVVDHGKNVSVVCNDPIAPELEYGSVTTAEYACRARTEDYFNNGGGAQAGGPHLQHPASLAEARRAVGRLRR
jgi:hypothetical protein